ncbi:GNAT family N-acetyltransferase [Aurantimonas sp. Leaf443]|uniref:GNAT family N-acetyltransferase n=1 Tax=Aurantimonas sp. Leaf443 TaxID=1736378 RepID=UPI0006FDE185|nr:GNAT family N-acetyltransferase [Aurantimonas sp. Leaf443]KQT87499.1 hypothetical protein ASG48_17050 [Aurantimonas sp. Leaf443]
MTCDELRPDSDEDYSIGSARLILRSLRRSDAAELARQAGDRRIAEMTGRIPHPYTLAHAHGFIADQDGEFVLAMTQKGEGRLIGVCGLKSRAEGKAFEIGYWVGREHWGKGFATEAAQVLIDVAFRQPGIECVHASCRVINRASRRVLEKCGFQMRRMGTMDSVYAGRVSTEDFHLDRRAWMALKAWGGR